MLTLAQALVYLVALVGIGASSLAFLFFSGRALNRARPGWARARSGLFAALSFLCIFASATAGFFGVGALLYLSSR